jgi:hypothetical protein
MLQQLQNVYIPPDQIDNTPSRRDGIDAETETRLRIYGCELIQESGILLRLYGSQLTQIVSEHIFWLCFESKLKKSSLKI